MKNLILGSLGIVLFCVTLLVSADEVGVPSGAKCTKWYAFSEGADPVSGSSATINGTPNNTEGATHFNCQMDPSAAKQAGVRLTGSEHWVLVGNTDGRTVKGFTNAVSVSDKTLRAASGNEDIQGAAITSPAGLKVLQAEAAKYK